MLHLRSKNHFHSDHFTQIPFHLDRSWNCERKMYSKMVSSQANLMADHNFTGDAEQAYRLAAQLEPSSPEAAYGLANLLARGGRNEEAQRVISDFQRRNP